MFADITNTTFHVYSYCLRQIYLFDHEGYWKEILVPTLVIHGEADTISPISNGREIAGMIKNAEFMPLTKTNHLLVINNAPAVIAEIKKFLYKNADSIKRAR